MKEYRQHKFEVPEGATEIILVRHGESRAATADNPFPLVEGQRWDVFPGAESREALQERIGRGLHRIAQAHPNELVVAVLHGGVIGQINAEATGSTPFAFNGCDNGSISRVVMVDGKIVVRGFNGVSHLGNAETLASLPT